MKVITAAVLRGADVLLRFIQVCCAKINTVYFLNAGWQIEDHPANATTIFKIFFSTSKVNNNGLANPLKTLHVMTARSHELLLGFFRQLSLVDRS